MMICPICNQAVNPNDETDPVLKHSIEINATHRFARLALQGEYSPEECHDVIHLLINAHKQLTTWHQT